MMYNLCTFRTFAFFSLMLPSRKYSTAVGRSVGALDPSTHSTLFTITPLHIVCLLCVLNTCGLCAVAFWHEMRCGRAEVSTCSKCVVSATINFMRRLFIFFHHRQRSLAGWKPTDSLQKCS